MILVSYSLYQLEWFVFNLFLHKFKKLCKTYNEKTRFNKIIQEVRYLHEYKCKKSSNIIYMNDILNHFGVSIKNEIFFNLWKGSIEDSIKFFVTYRKSTVKTGKTCCICLENEVDVYLLYSNVMHSCVCSRCAFRIMTTSTNPKCPLSRQYIEEVVYIEENHTNEETQVRILNDEMILYKDNKTRKYRVI